MLVVDPEAFNETPYAQTLMQIELGLKPWPEPDAKRHHFIPRFLLNRFAKADERLVQLDKTSSKPQSILANKAASRQRFYTFADDEGNRSSVLEGIFGMAEDDAAPALLRLEENGKLSDHDRASISLFLAYLWCRTPSARKQAERIGEEIRTGMLATQLADRHDFIAKLEKAAETDADLRMTPDEAEILRQRMIGQLKDGTVKSVDPDGGPTTELLIEVAHEMAMELFLGMEWTLLRSPSRKFVSSDRGVACHDPTPAHPWSGATLLSSPSSETFFPISSECCLAVTRGHGDPIVRVSQVSAAKALEVNLRIYGWADRYIYGQDQEVVVAVRRALKTSKRRFAVPPSPARMTTLIERDPDDDRLAQVHVQRGWPPYLTAVDDDGVPRDYDYLVLGEDGTAVEIGVTSEQLVEERMRRADGFAPGEKMPGSVNIKAISPRTVLPSRPQGGT